MSTSGGDLHDTIIRLVEPVVQPSTVLPHPQEPAPPPIVRWAMRVRGTTTVVPLDRPVDVGRQPGTSRIDERPAPRRVVIADSSGELSARHVRVEQVGETVVARSRFDQWCGRTLGTGGFTASASTRIDRGASRRRHHARRGRRARLRGRFAARVTALSAQLIAAPTTHDIRSPP